MDLSSELLLQSVTLHSVTLQSVTLHSYNYSLMLLQLLQKCTSQNLSVMACICICICIGINGMHMACSNKTY